MSDLVGEIDACRQDANLSSAFASLCFGGIAIGLASIAKRVLITRTHPAGAVGRRAADALGPSTNRRPCGFAKFQCCSGASSFHWLRY